MCGIVGYVSPRISDGNSLLKKMNRAIVHRGPDDEGIYSDSSRGIGMRRLSIIDLKSGHQPIWNEDKTIGIVFNGEIYNFPELREALIKKGHRFSTASDTEVIVHLYEEEGIRCVDHLNGMFAFAIYDKNLDQFFMARDRMGEKPLHYYHADGDFFFGSEIKSILAALEAKPPLNLEALNMYLTYEYVPAPYTIYQNIYKLPPAHYLLLKHGQMVIEPYWVPSFEMKKRGESLTSIITDLRGHIERAVAMRTISDVPLGAFLSGGIDSSLITAFLVKASSRRVQTFSIAFDDPSFDESSHAQSVARHLGTDHHEEKLDSQSMLNILPDVLKILDEPLADGSLIPTYLLSKYTRQYVTVALSGDGGDELFAGYPTYQAHQLSRWLPRILGKPLSALANALPVSDKNISFDFKMRRLAAGLSYDNPLRNQIWLGSFEPWQKKQLFTAGALRDLNKHDPFEVIKQYWNSCKSSAELNRVFCMDMRFYLQDDILVKVDRMSMANSLEARAPFLDHKLVEFACSLPPDLKLKGLQTKYLLKKAAQGILPESIIHRPKKGFGIPIAKWIKKELKDIFLETLSPAKLAETGLFNPQYVQNLFKEHFENRKDNRKLLWTLFTFEAWRQTH